MLFLKINEKSIKDVVTDVKIEAEQYQTQAASISSVAQRNQRIMNYIFFALGGVALILLIAIFLYYWFEKPSSTQDNSLI